jgi:hypothetical protein
MTSFQSSLLPHKSNSISISSKQQQRQQRQEMKLFQSFNKEDKTSTEIMSDVKQSQSQFTTPLDKPILATLDFVSIFIFAAVGKASHSPDGSLDIIAVTTTAFPFLVSWFVTSPLTGIYDEKKKEDGIFLDSAISTAKGWILAIPLGCVGRGLIKGYVPPLPFVIVTLIATLVILTTTRLLYTAIESKLIEE